MKRWDYIPQETCFWRRRIYEQAGGIDPSFQFALDYDLFVRFMERGRMERVDRFLGAFRRHPSSKTAGLVEGRVHSEVERVRRDIAFGCRVATGWLELVLSEMGGGTKPAVSLKRGLVLPGALAGVGDHHDRVSGREAQRSA